MMSTNLDLTIFQRSGMAERVGFEPTRALPPYTLSRRACSATPAPLHSNLRLQGGGEGGIRTRGALSDTPLFESGTINQARPPLHCRKDAIGGKQNAADGVLVRGHCALATTFKEGLTQL